MDQMLGKRIFKGIALAVLYSLILAVINDVSIYIWGKPRGVSFGILFYYLWVFLSSQGFATIILGCFVRPGISLSLSLLLILGTAYALFPGTFNPVYLTVICAAAALSFMVFLLGPRHQVAQQEVQA